MILNEFYKLNLTTNKTLKFHILFYIFWPKIIYRNRTISVSSFQLMKWGRCLNNPFWVKVRKLLPIKTGKLTRILLSPVHIRWYSTMKRQIIPFWPAHIDLNVPLSFSSPARPRQMMKFDHTASYPVYPWLVDQTNRPQLRNKQQQELCTAIAVNIAPSSQSSPILLLACLPSPGLWPGNAPHVAAAQSTICNERRTTNPIRLSDHRVCANQPFASIYLFTLNCKWGVGALLLLQCNVNLIRLSTALHSLPSFRTHTFAPLCVQGSKSEMEDGRCIPFLPQCRGCLGCSSEEIAVTNPTPWEEEEAERRRTMDAEGGQWKMGFGCTFSVQTVCWWWWWWFSPVCCTGIEGGYGAKHFSGNKHTHTHGL